MSKKLKNTLIIISLFLMIVIVGFIMFFLDDTEKTIPNYITIIGTVLSLIGLLITYVNVFALKSEAIVISEQITRTYNKINQLNSIADISKAIKIVQEIQNFIHYKKIELALLRLRDLKCMLIQFSEDQLLNELTKNKAFEEQIKDLGIDINSIDSYVLQSNRKVNFSDIIKNLEELSTYLTKFEMKFKATQI
jgi:hypothetical protein